MKTPTEFTPEQGKFTEGPFVFHETKCEGPFRHFSIGRALPDDPAMLANGMGADGEYMLLTGICTEADARQFAAADKLLHACRLIAENAPRIAEWLEQNDPSALKQVRAAIAAATGGQAQ